MTDQFSPEQRRDMLGRGFSRRDFGRLAAFLTAGAALPFYNEAALAQGLGNDDLACLYAVLGQLAGADGHGEAGTRHDH